MTVWALPSSDLQTRPTEHAGGRGLDGGAQAGAARADDQDVVFVDVSMLGHQKILQSVIRSPIEHRRTYRSVEADLRQADTRPTGMCRRLRQVTQS